MVVLLTDFGQSEYVGVMKGVIFTIDDRATIVDLCHTISGQSIVEASWVLKNNYKYFPQSSIFCCVVDPGVGTGRKALAVKTPRYYFVAPDNGLLWETLQQQQIVCIKQVPIPSDASHTFHGRDVFAKAAAQIHLGKFDDLGETIQHIEKLDLYQNATKGLVVRIDSFGNIVTNLRKRDKDKYDVTIEEKTHRMAYYDNYDAGPQDELFLIEGSNGTLEISLKNGNANDKLSLRAGQKIEIA